MNLPSMTFSQNALKRFEDVVEKEWLITNGLGGYASSSVLALNTRKYHGLLVAALQPPGDRTVCLEKLDEDIIVNNMVFRLGANDFQHTIYPEGYKLLKEITFSPFPTYTYEFSSVKVEKTLFMPSLKNAVCAIYKVNNQAASDAVVVVYPLLTCRYFHTVVDKQKLPLEFTQKSGLKEFQINFKCPQVAVSSRITEGFYRENINWIDGLHYRTEAERGEADFDDCFQPGFFHFTVPPSSQKTFVISTAAGFEVQAVNETLDSIGNSVSQIQLALEQELKQRSDLISSFYKRYPTVPMSDWLNWILLAADQFILQDTTAKESIIAGYFWFETWGRDTFISLPGLLLATGKFKVARSILQNYIQYCKNGVIPNFISDRTREPAYNTVDATFWYVNAVLQYLKYTGDWDFIKNELWESMKTIVEYHKKGIPFGIHLDNDGLIQHAPRLTWMDAMVNDEPITPRQGKAVEIQALWYNTLRVMNLLARKFGEQDLSEEYSAMAIQTKKGFNEKFWNPQLGCLYDVVDAKGADASIRPNQIFAVSLDFTMLEGEKSVKVVDVVNRELVTPYGLRTLAVGDPKFVGKCFGDRRSRDVAYHNGTIWPWLLGPYITANLKINKYSQTAREDAFKNLILPLFSVGIQQGGLGTISEIYDCEPPNKPRGCIAQAWSVGEPLRAYVEDVLQIRPKHANAVLGV